MSSLSLDRHDVRLHNVRDHIRVGVVFTNGNGELSKNTSYKAINIESAKVKIDKNTGLPKSFLMLVTHYTFRLARFSPFLGHSLDPTSSNRVGV